VLADNILLPNNTNQNPGNCTGSGLRDDGYNVADDGSCFASGSTSIVSTDSAIGPLVLAANGSPGPETEAITSFSSAFEVVPSTNCTVTTDQRGDPRPGFAGQNCDAGAFELQ